MKNPSHLTPNLKEGKSRLHAPGGQHGSQPMLTLAKPRTPLAKKRHTGSRVVMPKSALSEI